MGDVERAESAWRPGPELAAALRAAPAEPDRCGLARAQPAQCHRRWRHVATGDEDGPLRGRVHARHAPRGRALRRLLAPPVPAVVRARPPGDAATDPALHSVADDGEPAVPAPRRDAELRAKARLADRVRVQDEP